MFIVIFYRGFRGFVDMATPPDYAYEIKVRAVKWAWEFTYPNGGTSPDLLLPKDIDVRLVLSSDDVIHSLFVPTFRMKKDVVPGRFNETWVRATELSDAEGFDLFCAEYCGTSHSQMVAKAFVYEPSVFAAKMTDIIDTRKNPPIEAGAKVYKDKGCMQCHGPNLGGGTGPKLTDLYGWDAVPLADGTTVKADDNYIRNAVLNPGDQIHAGYENVMPSFKGRLNDDEIYALIQFLKSNSSRAPKPIEIWPDDGTEADADDGADSAASADNEAGGATTQEPTTADSDGQVEASDEAGDAANESTDDATGEAVDETTDETMTETAGEPAA